VEAKNAEKVEDEAEEEVEVKKVETLEKMKEACRRDAV
jgi:hypothetical protein